MPACSNNDKSDFSCLLILASITFLLTLCSHGYQIISSLLAFELVFAPHTMSGSKRSFSTMAGAGDAGGDDGKRPEQAPDKGKGKEKGRRGDDDGDGQGEPSNTSSSISSKDFTAAERFGKYI